MRKVTALLLTATLVLSFAVLTSAADRTIVKKAPVLRQGDFQVSAKPGRILNVETSATATWIDTAANAYSMLYQSVNALFYESTTGNITFGGRALGVNLTGSGVLGFNYSTDGGATWPNRQIDLNEPNHTTGARYPSSFATADYPIILYTENNGGGGSSNGDPILLWDFGWGMGLWTYNDFHEETPYPDLWGASPTIADNGNIVASFISFTGGEDYYLSYSGNTSDLTTFTANLDASIFPADVTGSNADGSASVLNKSSADYTGGGYMTVGGAWDMDSASSAPRDEDRNLVYKLSSDDGATWGDAVLVGEADIAGYPAQTDTTDAFFQTYATNHQVDGDGDVHFTGNLVYYDTDTTQAVITAHVSSESGTWTLHVVDTPDVALTGGALCGTGCEMGEVSVTPSGGLVYVYQRGTAETDTVVGGMIASDVYVSFSADGGVTWSTPENITNTPGVDEMMTHTSPTVEVLSNGDERVHIIYFVDVEEPIGNLVGKHVYYHDYYDYTPIVGVRGEKGLPDAFTLKQNYPNPFNPSTSIDYTLNTSSHVTLTVFNMLGQEVKTLVNGIQEAGEHTASWDASGTVSGVYFYQLTTPDLTVTKKMVMLK